MVDEQQRSQVRDAFGRQAPVFDALDEQPMIQWVRDRVRVEALRWIKPGDELLEINCGTGIDSRWFARKGIRVMATDDSPGMLGELERKRALEPALPLTCERRSFLELEGLGSERFDAVFSNFGGINCTDRLEEVLRGIDACLRPGGVCVLVIMPRVSPWELMEVARGNFAMAFRRFRRKGASAQVEGVTFRCWYHSARSVKRSLPHYHFLSREALSFFAPPPHWGPFAARHPRLTSALQRIERSTCRWPWIRVQGDHTLLVLRKPS